MLLAVELLGSTSPAAATAAAAAAAAGVTTVEERMPGNPMNDDGWSLGGGGGGGKLPAVDPGVLNGGGMGMGEAVTVAAPPLEDVAVVAADEPGALPSLTSARPLILSPSATLRRLVRLS